MAKRTIVARIPGFSRTVGFDRDEGQTVKDGEKLTIEPIELTQEELEARLAVPVAQAAADALYDGARGALDTKLGVEENARIFADFIYGADDLRTVRAGDVSADTAKMLAAASADDLRAMGVRFISE